MYIIKVMTKINSLIIVHETLKLKILMINVEIRGVATLKVVAVPAISEKTAVKSINLPNGPSVLFFSSGRHASEYF